MTETMTDISLQTTAAEAFARLVPASARLAVRRLGPAERNVPASDAVVVTFVGKRSADLAVVHQSRWRCPARWPRRIPAGPTLCAGISPS